jgi:hypothetical protein
MAFVILPLPWWMIRQPEQFKPLAIPLRATHWAWGLLLVTCGSFMATSPPYWYRLAADAPGNVRFYESPYKIKKSLDDILARLAEEGIAFEQYERQNTVGTNYHYLGDSSSQARHRFYVIPQLIVDDDTLNDIHFVLSPVATGEASLILQSMNVPDSSAAYINGKMNKMYLRLLKKELVRKVRRD